MVQDIKPGTEEQLQKEMTTGYIGFDPTAELPACGKSGAYHAAGTSPKGRA